jgi:co-chaperonin GroES (HSP10)
MKIETHSNNVIFKFVEKTTQDRFVNSSKAGIIISSQDSTQGQVARWGHVTHVGDDVDAVKPGDYILIEHGMWTNGFYVDDVRYWKTDEDKIMAVSDEPYTTY